MPYAVAPLLFHGLAGPCGRQDERSYAVNKIEVLCEAVDAVYFSEAISDHMISY